MDDLMNVKEAAKYLRVNYMTVYKMVQKRRIPATKVGGNWRFKKEILDEWLLRNTTSSSGTILAVDEDTETLIDLKQIVQKQGYSMYTASTNETAQKELGRQRFDLVFLNLKSSGINGKSLLKSIKDEAKDAVVVIFIKDSDDLKTLKVLAQGPLMLVRKPVKEKDIIELLTMVI